MFISRKGYSPSQLPSSDLFRWTEEVGTLACDRGDMKFK